MALIPASEELSDLKREFVRLCRENSVFDRSKKWVYLDRLWWETDMRARFSRLVVEYLCALIKDYPPDQTIIVSPDTISSSFGATPVVFIAADKLNYPVAVWQELGDLVARKPITIGTRRTGLRCIIVQDVIRYGTTVLKMISSFTERQWDIVTYACLVLNCPRTSILEQTQLEYQKRTGSELEIQYLIKVDSLM